MSQINLRDFLKSLTEPAKGLMPDVIKSIENVLNATQDLRLSTDYIGEGENLYHVSVLAVGWDSPCLWLVAADSEVNAVLTAVKQYDGDDESEPESFDADDQEVYLIGRFL